MTLQKVSISIRYLEKQRLYEILESYFKSRNGDFAIDVALKKSLETAKISDSNETYFDLLNKISVYPLDIPGFVLERQQNSHGDNLKVVFLQSDGVFESSFSDLSNLENVTREQPEAHTATNSEDSFKLEHDVTVQHVNNCVMELQKEIESLRQMMYSRRSQRNLIAPETEKKNEDDVTATQLLEEDTYSLMMRSKVLSMAWLLGLASACVQITLACIALREQIDQSKNNSLWNIPFRVTNSLRIGQYFTIVVFISSQSDLFSSIRTIQSLSYRRSWEKVINVHTEDKSISTWIVRIFFPNFVKFGQALLVTMISFILIAQSEGIIFLLKDFSALVILSDVDNSFFALASKGYLGKSLIKSTQEIIEGVSMDVAKREYRLSQISMMNLNPKKKKKFYFRYFPLLLFWTMVTGGILFQYFIVATKQDDGTYFRQKYPTCKVEQEQIKKIGDGHCDGGYLNTRQCGLDGGDCSVFKSVFPNCKFANVSKIGDGVCDPKFKIKDCGFDELDCCPYSADDIHIGDNICNGGYYVSGICGNDKDDCDTFRAKNKNCDLEQIAEKLAEQRAKYSFIKEDHEIIIGDGVCDSGAYISPDCDFEGGDCTACLVDNYNLIGDGKCDGGSYNSEYCHYDYGDCINNNYTDCHVDFPDFIGDGICDAIIFNAPNCLDDGGDCSSCNVTERSKIGDSICHDDLEGHNTKACQWDGQDCNRARKMQADQSSIIEASKVAALYADLVEDPKTFYGPQNANDGVSGREQYNYAITGNETDPWWQVYLSNIYEVEAVMIYSITSKYIYVPSVLLYMFQIEFKLNGEIVHIQQYYSEPVKDRILITVEKKVQCNEVRITIPQEMAPNGASLALGEVEVYGQIHLENLALRRDSEQVVGGAVYEEKVLTDGNINLPGLEALAVLEGKVKIHFQDISKVQQIKLRFDSKSHKRGGNYSVSVYVGNEKTYSFRNENAIPVKNTVDIDLPVNISGNLIELTSYPTDGGLLVVTEIEAFGTPTLKNVALGKLSEQSSKSRAATGPERAVDGSIYSSDKISQTLPENNPWWQVELSAKYEIQKIIYYLPSKGYGTTWADMYGLTVEIWDIEEEEVKFSYTVTTVISIQFANIINLPTPVIGNRVRFELKRAEAVLTLQEVEVYGNPVS